MDVRPGLTLGRYTIDSELGRGGMGQVMLATDKVLERKVALKILLPGLLTKEEIVARFFREARLAARLTHPNTAHIYDLGEVDDVLFIAMEYIEGRALTAYLGDSGVAPDRRLRWLVDVARGLGAAHAQGLFHRDIKPANVMVSKDNVAKVVDFGLAKKEAVRIAPHVLPKVGQTMTPELRATFHTAAGFVIGTPAYMAPEQLEGLPVDARTDQFGWALTAYALMLGKNLRTEDPLLFGPIPLICERVPGVSRRTSEIVLRALSHDREMRFASMDALLAELEPSLAGAAPGAAPAAAVGTVPLAAPVNPAAVAFSNHPTPRMATAPQRAHQFCSDCGLSLGMSSPDCKNQHAEAFPKPPGSEP